MVEPTYKVHWEVPEGWSSWAATRHRLGSAGLLPNDGLMLLYAAGPIDTSQIAIPPHEFRSWEWCDRKTVMARVPDFMFRRVEVALEALATGSVVELQNGYVDRVMRRTGKE